MRVIITILALGVAVVLAACGQQVASVPTAQPTSQPTLPAPPTDVAAPTEAPASPTVAPTSVPSATGAPQTPTPGTTSSAATPTVSATTQGGRVTDTPASQASQGSNNQQIGDLALRSLQALPAVGDRSLTVQSVEAQEWSDSSLGCPDPAAIYLAVITPGYKVTLSDGSTSYAVHTNSDGSSMVWCNAGKPETVPPVS